ncbi:LysM peptidoglycan-binding domain-containing protein [Mucilaginibacter litoreus]|uniref:LysM peptidoglycan-binding domain-containing protein n=1 Tax=Mucilaginibacter litoreus TaxID=1048221 RepID=A0ABW3APB6_9SPHI
MRLKKLLLSAMLFTFSTPLFAIAMPADSVGIENNNGKKVILHKLDPKDNYYSLGRKYGVSPKVIQQFNNNASMRIGNIIKVPTERSFVETVKPVPTPAQKAPQTQVNAPASTTVTTTPQQQAANKPKGADTTPAQTTPASATTQEYKVSAHETLYAIAKRFNTTVDAITSLNKLTSTNLVPGQVLQVPNGVTAPPPPAPAPLANREADTVKRDSTYVAPDSLNRNLTSPRYGLFEKNEKGVATWIDDASLDPNKKLILHRTAPIGTVMRITNPMNGKTTFAKVVGRFTDTESTRDAIIVMTKNVADALGALDKRFHVNISYGTPNE